MKTIWNLKFVSLCDFEASPFQSQFLVSLNSKNKLSAPTDSILVFSFCSEEPLFGFKATHGDPFVKADYFQLKGSILPQIVLLTQHGFIQYVTQRSKSERATTKTLKQEKRNLILGSLLQNNQRTVDLIVKTDSIQRSDVIDVEQSGSHQAKITTEILRNIEDKSMIDLFDQYLSITAEKNIDIQKQHISGEEAPIENDFKEEDRGAIKAKIDDVVCLININNFS